MSRILMRPPAILLTGLLLLLGAAPAAASVAGAQCLQIPPGARANGLGEASVALADDATAAWWNPAGLSFMRGRTLGLMHSKLLAGFDIDDIYYEYAGWVHHLEGVGTYGISFIFLNYGESPITSDSPDVEGYFSSYEFAPVLSYGLQLDDNTAVGVSIKYVRVDLAPAHAVHDPGAGEGAGSSVAVDVGVLRRFGRLSLGAAATNWGPNISFINEEQSDPMPRHLKAGAVYTFYEGDYGVGIVNLDVNQMVVSGGPFTAGGGTEFQYMDLMALRVGYVYDPDGYIEDWTFGGGFHVNLSGRDFYFDYASIPQYEDLDRVHRFSFEMHF